MESPKESSKRESYKQLWITLTPFSSHLISKYMLKVEHEACIFSEIVSTINEQAYH